MASAADIDAKNTELQAQAALVDDLLSEFATLAGPYHEKLAQVTAEIAKLQQLDAQMETLTKDYQAPAAPIA